MFNVILYLIGAALPLMVLCFLYRKQTPRMLRVWARMVRSENARRFVGNVLTIAVAFMHINMYSVFPKEMGLMISTIFIIVMLSSDRAIVMLNRIRNSRPLFACLGMLTLAMAFINPLLPTAITLSFILSAASLLPGKKARDFDLEDNSVEQLIADYFA